MWSGNEDCFVMYNGVSTKSPQVFIKVHKIHKILMLVGEKRERESRLETPHNEWQRDILKCRNRQRAGLDEADCQEFAAITESMLALNWEP